MPRPGHSACRHAGPRADTSDHGIHYRKLKAVSFGKLLEHAGERLRPEMDPGLRQELKHKLSSLSAGGEAVTPREPSPFDRVNQQQEVLRQKLYREISAEYEERFISEHADRLAEYKADDGSDG